MDACKDDEKKKISPRILEIVGPAGAGKSTLYQSLIHGREDTCLGNFPNVRSVFHAPFFLHYGLKASFALRQVSQGSNRKLTRRELAWLAILSGWPALLQKELKTKRGVIVLDQGPVYLLAELRLSGPDFLRWESAGSFWRANFCQWAAVLGAIVWLDAPDQCLLQRIRTREKDHMVKDQSDQVALEVLRRYRKMYEQILSELQARRRGIQVLRFDTSGQTPEEIAGRLLFEM
jgi:hypothetical protein